MIEIENNWLVIINKAIVALYADVDYATPIVKKRELMEIIDGLSEIREGLIEIIKEK